MRFDNTPVPAERMGLRPRSEPRVAPWRGNFDDPVPRPRPGRPDHRAGYGSAFAPDQGARAAASGRQAVRPDGTRPSVWNPPPPPAVAGIPPGLTHRMRDATRNHTGAVALTAAVVGAGVSAGMLGFALFAQPGPAAAMPAHMPQTVTMAGAVGSVPHHAGYVGRHRKPAPAPPARQAIRPPAGLGATPAGGPSAVSSAGGGTTSGRGSPPPPAPPPTSPPPPRTPAGGHHPESQGGVGGLLGGLTGLVGGLTSSL